MNKVEVVNKNENNEVKKDEEMTTMNKQQNVNEEVKRSNKLGNRVLHKGSFKLGNIVLSEGLMPQVEVIADSKIYYLSPFRLYGFQVSGNIKGVRNCGSSIRFGILHTMKTHKKDGLVKEVLRLQVSEALNEHNLYYEDHWVMSLEEDIILNRFLDATIEYAESVEKERIESAKKKNKENSRIRRVINKFKRK